VTEPGRPLDGELQLPPPGPVWPEGESELEASLVDLFTRARHMVHAWFEEAQEVIGTRMAAAETEAARVLERARMRARTLVDEATAEAERARGHAHSGSPGVDPRALQQRVDVLAETVTDTVAAAEELADTVRRQLAPGPSSSELDRSVNRLSSAVRDVLHSLGELQGLAEAAGESARRPPWEESL